LGVVCLRHDVPFHASASVSVIPEAFTNEPTATHDVADGQDMDLIRPPGSVMLGECCMVQPGLAASAAPVGIAAEETIAKTAIAFAVIEVNICRHIASPAPLSITARHRAVSTLMMHLPGRIVTRYTNIPRFPCWPRGASGTSNPARRSSNVRPGTAVG
jgi:hypothetical protein